MNKIIIKDNSEKNTEQIFNVSQKELTDIENICHMTSIVIPIEKWLLDKYGFDKCNFLLQDIIERYASEDYFDERIINSHNEDRE